MTEFKVTVVRVGQIDNHPNADNLSITNVFDYPVIVRRGEWKQGDLAIYVPVDSLVPDIDKWYFLCPESEGIKKYALGNVPERSRVIRAKKIRGIFSQGLLTTLDFTASVGDDVATTLGITKYEPDERLVTAGECETGPLGWSFNEYTDIEGLRRNPDVLCQGEEVVLTEKIHGTNARYVHDGNRLWVGSHHQIKRYDPNNVYWNVAVSLKIDAAISSHPFHIFFGEVYGPVQNLKYGLKKPTFKVFDVFDVKRMVYLDHDDATSLAANCGLEWVPSLYRGPWCESLGYHADGQTTLGADHCREGFVVKPIKERWDSSVGRVILKRHGEEYLLTKKR